MLRTYLFLSVSFYWFFAIGNENQPQATTFGLLTSIDSEPSGMVDGCINVISGEFVDFEIDLTIPAPEPLKVQRCLVNNNAHPFVREENKAPCWRFDETSSVSIREDEEATTKIRRHPHRLFGEYEGACGEFIQFKLHKEDKKKIVKGHFNPELLKYGFTNTSKGVIAARDKHSQPQFNLESQKIFM